MALKLGAGARLELRWWWEEAPPGEPVILRDPLAARLAVGHLLARPEHAAALRRFLSAGAPSLGAPPEHGDLLDRLASAIAAGQVRIAKTPAEALGSFGDVVEEQAPVEPVARRAPEPEPAREDICWPCLLRAGASARTLREAAGDGTPFIVAG